MDAHEGASTIKSEPSDPTEDLDTTNDSLNHDTSMENDQDECISTCHSASTTVAGNTSSQQARPASTTMAASGESPSQAQDALVPYLHTPTASTDSTTGTTVTVPVIPPRDDLDLILMHEDFPKILIFLAKVKQYRGILFHAPHGRPLVLPPTTHLPIDRDDHQVTTSVVRMQNQLLSPASRQEVVPSSSALVSSSSSVLPSTGRVVVRRGEYPFTDGTIDVALNSLENEFSRLSLFVQRAAHRHPPVSVAGEERRSIAVKYSKWQTDLLMGWMINNVESPFPNPEDMSDLMYSTGLSNSQVVNWTTNVRKRNRKATVEDGKKPHHFLDFMFLLNHHNETKQKRIGRGETVHDDNDDHQPPSPPTSRSSKKKSGSKMKSNSKPSEADATQSPPSPLQSNPNATVSNDSLVSRQASAVTAHPQGQHHSYQPQQEHPQHQQYQLYQHQQHAPHPNDAQYFDHEYEARYAQYQQSELYQQHYHQYQPQYYYHPRQHHGESIEYPPAAGTSQTETDASPQADEAAGTTWSAESTSQGTRQASQDYDKGDAQYLLLNPSTRLNGEQDTPHGSATTTAPGSGNSNKDSMVNDTAEMFSQLPFDGIGDDDMVLGDLSSMGNARSHNGDTQDNNHAEVDTASTGIRLTQEQAFLCDWLPEILPSVTHETHEGSSSSASADTQDSDVAVSSTAGQEAGGGTKRGRASSLDAREWTASLLGGGESADV